MVTLMRLWHLFECRPQLFTQKLWHEGVDTFIVQKKSLETWTEVFGNGEIKKIKDVGDNLALVNIDLYQWMHLRGVERAELLINYCRRPDKDSKPGNAKLVTIADTTVKIQHEVDLGEGMVKCEKIVPLKAGAELTLVKWKTEELVVVNAVIGGKPEDVAINKQELLEKADAWDSELFLTACGLEAVEEAEAEGEGEGELDHRRMSMANLPAEKSLAGKAEVQAKPSTNGREPPAGRSQARADTSNLAVQPAGGSQARADTSSLPGQPTGRSQTRTDSSSLAVQPTLQQKLLSLEEKLMSLEQFAFEPQGRA